MAVNTTCEKAKQDSAVANGNESTHSNDHRKRDATHSNDHKKRNIPFSHLPLNPTDPPYSAWSLWGASDELGTLNLLTPQTTKAASSEIQHGLTIPLNLPLDFLVRPMNPARKPCVHHIKAKGNANDDSLQMDTQGSSHFDGLRHYPYQDGGLYYGGVTQEEIMSGGKLGLQNVAKRGIVARGVLLDWCRWAERKGVVYSPFERFAIPLWQLEDVAKEQKVEFREGDVLIVRTGWTAAYSALSLEEKLALPEREVRASCGVEASVEALKWHWDHGFAAVASDTVAYEVWPSPREAGFSMHEVFLSGWGMMIGESWDLEELGRQCEKLQKWTFFFSSQPLNVNGGVASLANAMAIL